MVAPGGRGPCRPSCRRNRTHMLVSKIIKINISPMCQLPFLLPLYPFSLRWIALTGCGWTPRQRDKARWSRHPSPCPTSPVSRTAVAAADVDGFACVASASSLKIPSSLSWMTPRRPPTYSTRFQSRCHRRSTRVSASTMPTSSSPCAVQLAGYQAPSS